MNKVYLKIAAVLLLAGLSARNGNAQAVGGVSPDRKMLSGSPTGASLESLNAPNLFTGSLNINIPIYQYSHDQQNYGISLSYNTKGVKIDETAEPPGLHWNLNAGCSIVRVVHGLPDELNVVTDSLMEYSTTGMDTMMPNKEMYFKGRLATYEETPMERARPNSVQDGESDEFIVSLSGSSFSFYIGKDFKIFTHPHWNVKITMLVNGAPATSIPELNEQGGTSNLNYIGSPDIAFVLADESGNRYYFKPEVRDYSMKPGYWDWNLIFDGAPPHFNPIVKWMADKILFANGDSLTYEYEPADPSYFPYTFDYFNYYVRENPPGTSSPTFLGIDAPQTQFPPNHITAIHYPNGVDASFTYFDINAVGNPLLNEIRITSGGNCLRYRLYHGSVNGRKFLDKITILSCDSSKEELYYRFSYNTSPSLPGRLNGAQDLFGYYNGDSTGTAVAAPNSSGAAITIPRHHPDIGGAANYGNERAYSYLDAKAGLLISIENAYGGKLEYDYAAQSGTGQLDGLPTDNYFIGADAVDGVKLNYIRQTDKYAPDDYKLTLFHYGNGQIFMPGGYFHYPEYIDSMTGDWSKLVFQSMFLTPHQLIQGSNHGYSDVTIETVDRYYNLLSRRQIKFSNIKDATSNNEARYYKVPGSKDYFQYPYTDKQYLKDWEIGLPLTITDYDQNGRIVRKTINKYRFNDSVECADTAYFSNTKTVKVNSGTEAAPYSLFSNYYPYQIAFTDTYYPFNGWAPLDTTIIQKYVSDSRYVSDTVVYAYDGHHNLFSTITQNSNGDRIATSMVYNYDIDGPDVPYGSPHPGTTLYSMSDSGLEYVISSERWLLHPSTQVSGDGGGVLLLDNDLLLNAYITGYRYQDGKLWTGSLWNTNTGSPLTHTQYTGLIGGSGGNPYGKALDAYNDPASLTGFRQASQVKLFDEKGNPLETQLLGQNQFKAMIWNTATGQKLADAANCHYNDIAYSSFEDIYRFSTLEPVFRGNLKFNRFACIPDSSLAFTAMSGSHVYKLAPGQTGGVDNDLYDTASLSTGKEYILSFWVYGSLPPVYLGQTALTAPDPVYSKGSWHNYQFRFTASGSGKLHIAPLSFATVYLDEIRLYPAGAQMQSNTYEPLFGISSRTDASGRITYYEYDAFGRQTLVRDQDGNILSRSVYTIGR